MNNEKFLLVSVMILAILSIVMVCQIEKYQAEDYCPKVKTIYRYNQCEECYDSPAHQWIVYNDLYNGQIMHLKNLSRVDGFQGSMDEIWMRFTETIQANRTVWWSIHMPNNQTLIDQFLEYRYFDLIVENVMTGNRDYWHLVGFQPAVEQNTIYTDGETERKR